MRFLSRLQWAHVLALVSAVSLLVQVILVGIPPKDISEIVDVRLRTSRHTTNTTDFEVLNASVTDDSREFTAVLSGGREVTMVVLHFQFEDATIGRDTQVVAPRRNHYLRVSSKLPLRDVIVEPLDRP